MLSLPQLGIEISSGEFVAIILSVLLLMLTVGIMYIILTLRKRTYESRSREKHLYDFYRKEFEHQILEINDRILSNEKRWKDANRLLIEAVKGTYGEDFESEKNPINVTSHRFLRHMGISESVRIENDLIFLLTPFHEDFYDEYISIRNLCSDINLRCERGDEQIIETDLLSHIIRRLMAARIIIAVVDGRSPNVFLELGIAYGLDKTVIQVARDAEDIPVDLRARKFVIYRSLKDLHSKLKTELTRVFAAGH